MTRRRSFWKFLKPYARRWMSFIKPGTPNQNAFIESLNSRIRKRLVDGHWFRDLGEVRKEAGKWRKVDNTAKRHGSLNRQTPEQFGGHCRLRSATTPFDSNGQKPTTTLVGPTQ